MSWGLGAGGLRVEAVGVVGPRLRVQVSKGKRAWINPNLHLGVSENRGP